jgi:hypothetical protein
MLEPSRSKHLPRSPPLNTAFGTKSSAHGFGENISYPNHNVLDKYLGLEQLDHMAGACLIFKKLPTYSPNGSTVARRRIRRKQSRSKS